MLHKVVESSRVDRTIAISYEGAPTSGTAEVAVQRFGSGLSMSVRHQHSGFVNVPLTRGAAEDLAKALLDLSMDLPE